MTNPLYCVITTTRYEEALEEAFTKDISEYFKPKDYYSMVGFDVDKESIYFMFFAEWKILRMIDFFRRSNILFDYQIVTNVIDFIHSDKKFLEVFSDVHNKNVINNYIIDTVTVTIDDVLDRINENRNNKDYFLLPIEKEVLGVFS